MGHIVALDRNMVNMIAAGEVIERPASVVKELMENSIDAGATRINVSIEDGGRRLISVSDNGCGMDAEDLSAAFDAHATSKIKVSSDLRAISTLGFRGEALASIASVAQVRAVSRTPESNEANCIQIDCGRKDSVSPCSADCGTTIEVRDLFYKLPARRKFLRTANTEMTHVREQFIRIALARSDIGLTLSHNGREVCQVAAGQSLRRRIADLLSTEIAENLVETEYDEKGVHIVAFLGTPGTARTSNKFQYFFLNGRFVRDKLISHAVKEAYRGLVEPDRFAVVFLFIEMPSQDIDVNVHPTKIEVRFYNANMVHSQILSCLRQRLLCLDSATPAKLSTGASGATLQQGLAATEGRRHEIAEAMAEFFRRHRPVETQRQFSYCPQTRPGPRVELPKKDKLRAVQVHDSYIVAETGDGFAIIDQHALHERIMYETLSRRLRNSKLQSQKLLIPESFALSDAQANAAENNSQLLEKLGLELAPFGPRTMAVQAFPILLSNAPPAEFTSDLLDLLAEKDVADDPAQVLDEVLRMAACKAAIKAGQKLSDSEIEQLLADREKVECPGRCPHGRPTVLKFTMAELEKQFKRT